MIPWKDFGKEKPTKFGPSAADLCVFTYKHTRESPTFLSKPCHYHNGGFVGFLKTDDILNWCYVSEILDTTTIISLMDSYKEGYSAMFETGDQVRVKTGGPTMTVNKVVLKNVHCFWMSKTDTIQSFAFHETVIEKVPVPMEPSLELPVVTRKPPVQKPEFPKVTRADVQFHDLFNPSHFYGGQDADSWEKSHNGAVLYLPNGKMVGYMFSEFVSPSSDQLARTFISETDPTIGDYFPVTFVSDKPRMSMPSSKVCIFYFLTDKVNFLANWLKIPHDYKPFYLKLSGSPADRHHLAMNSIGFRRDPSSDWLTYVRVTFDVAHEPGEGVEPKYLKSIVPLKIPEKQFLPARLKESLTIGEKTDMKEWEYVELDGDPLVLASPAEKTLTLFFKTTNPNPGEYYEQLKECQSLEITKQNPVPVTIRLEVSGAEYLKIGTNIHLVQIDLGMTNVNDDVADDSDDDRETDVFSKMFTEYAIPQGDYQDIVFPPPNQPSATATYLSLLLPDGSKICYSVNDLNEAPPDVIKPSDYVCKMPKPKLFWDATSKRYSLLFTTRVENPGNAFSKTCSELPVSIWNHGTKKKICLNPVGFKSLIVTSHGMLVRMDFQSGESDSKQTKKTFNVKMISYPNDDSVMPVCREELAAFHANDTDKYADWTRQAVFCMENGNGIDFPDINDGQVPWLFVDDQLSQCRLIFNQSNCKMSHLMNTMVMAHCSIVIPGESVSRRLKFGHGNEKSNDTNWNHTVVVRFEIVG